MRLSEKASPLDAGHAPAFGPQRPGQHEAELLCIERLGGYDLEFAPSIREPWLEYEAQVSVESRWVKAMDRIMPFILNLSTQGATGTGGEPVAGAQGQSTGAGAGA